eukprot:6839399-Pyramimonas_sp.AAC.1
MTLRNALVARRERTSFRGPSLTRPWTNLATTMRASWYAYRRKARAPRQTALRHAPLPTQGR